MENMHIDAREWRVKKDRFHVAVCLFSDRSQMTSKCGRNKKGGTQGTAESVTDVFTTFCRPLLFTTVQSHRNMVYICFIKRS